MRNVEISGWNSSPVKRGLDVVLAIVGVLVTAPLLIGIAVLIKLDSAGPALYRQERVGRGFRRFKMVKFRTMVEGADRAGGALTLPGDPRVTRVGRALRRFKVDEVLQLLNVVAGHMSLVGPRPEVPAYVNRFREDYEVILAVRPGMTDLASLKYRDEAVALAKGVDPETEYVKMVLPEKIRLAKAYIRRSSVVLDAVVVVFTVLALLGFRPPSRIWDEG